MPFVQRWAVRTESVAERLVGVASLEGEHPVVPQVIADQILAEDELECPVYQLYVIQREVHP